MSDFPNLSKWCWQLADGRIWSTQLADFVTDHAWIDAWLLANALVTIPASPVDENGNNSLEGLRKALQFYQLSLGTLATTADLLAYTANKRWEIETGGIVINGINISTDERSQGMINRAYAYMQARNISSIKYKTENGFIDLDFATLTTIALAVGAHVQACFSAEAEIVNQINNGVIINTNQIDTYSWLT